MAIESAEELIKVVGATKTYTAENVLTYAANDVDVAIRAGEVVAITGPSGSGKSTLLALLGLLDRPTKGEVVVGGEATAALPAAARARLRNRTFAYVFQNFSLIPQLSAIDNVMLPLVYRQLPAVRRRDAAMEALTRVGMAHRIGHMPAQLSGGEQQRVAIARALVTRPRAILADEPTGNLDSTNAARVVDLLLQLNENGSAIVLVTHDSSLASLATRRVALKDGRIVADDGASAPPVAASAMPQEIPA